MHESPQTEQTPPQFNGEHPAPKAEAARVGRDPRGDAAARRLDAALRRRIVAHLHKPEPYGEPDPEVLRAAREAAETLRALMPAVTP